MKKVGTKLQIKAICDVNVITLIHTSFLNGSMNTGSSSTTSQHARPHSKVKSLQLCRTDPRHPRTNSQFILRTHGEKSSQIWERMSTTTKTKLLLRKTAGGCKRNYLWLHVVRAVALENNWLGWGHTLLPLEKKGKNVIISFLENNILVGAKKSRFRNLLKMNDFAELKKTKKLWRIYPNLYAKKKI